MFPDRLEKSYSPNNTEKFRYRIRISNFGKRDLIEVSIKARIIVRNNNYKNHILLHTANEGFIPILRRRKQGHIRTQIYTVSVGREALWEFGKAFYSDIIREKAQSGTLSIDDLFEEYSSAVSIQFFLFGNDQVTGARQFFSSCEYRLSDCIEGKYKPINNLTCYKKRTAKRIISDFQLYSQEPSVEFKSDEE